MDVQPRSEFPGRFVRELDRALATGMRTVHAHAAQPLLPHHVAPTRATEYSRPEMDVLHVLEHRDGNIKEIVSTKELDPGRLFTFLHLLPCLH